MQELQSDDFYIPAFLFKPLPQPETRLRETQTDDFLEGIQGWAEYFPVDECVE